jgi:hypothetical protein
MKALLCLALVVLAHAGPQPKFSNDWTAVEEDDLMVMQGDYTTSGNNYCCAVTSNCQVQTEYQKGNTYFDYTNNRTRFDDQISGQIIVTDFSVGKEMLVVGSPLTCKEYCPTEGWLEPGFLDPNATDLGSVKVQGRTLEKWQWKETIFKIIVMQTSTVLVDQTVNPAVPFQETDDLTPFGQPMGTFTSTWSNFKNGTPDPSLFAVTGVEKCPMAQNCGEARKQMTRLRNKDFATFAKYAQQNRFHA